VKSFNSSKYAADSRVKKKIGKGTLEMLKGRRWRKKKNGTERRAVSLQKKRTE
jgi:hypothetical protein